ncbi:MAG: BamA/TamA family outer membrane protein [Solitalea-like symbiont of Acarus siro]
MYLIRTLLFIIIIVSLQSCNSARYINDNQYLLNKVTLKGIPNELSAEAKSFLVKPNKLFGILLGLYNAFNIKDGQYKEDPINIGEAPVLYHKEDVDLSSNKLKEFLESKGYFKASVKYNIDIVSAKKIANINYIVGTGNRYKIKDFSYIIKDSVLADLYRKHDSQLYLKKEEYYDVDSINSIVSKTITLFNNNGYKDFTKQYINFQADTTFSDSEVALRMVINNPLGRLYHTAYSINNTYITINYNDLRYSPKSSDISPIGNSLFLVDSLHKFNPNLFTDYNFFKKGSLYSLSNYLITYDRLINLGPFQAASIEVVPLKEDTTKLNIYVNLVALKQQSLSVSGEYSYSGGNNAALSASYANRNIFRSATYLNMGLKGGKSFYRVKGNLVTALQLDFLATIRFPRISHWLNINVDRNYNTSTNLNFNINYGQRPELAYTSYTYLHSFNFATSINKNFTIAPISIGLMNSELNTGFIDNLISSGNVETARQLRRRYQPYVLLSSQVAYDYNSNLLFKNISFNYLRASLDLSGNLAWLLAHFASFPKDSSGSYLIAGRPFSQYVRPEIDFRMYRNINSISQIIFRVNLAFGLAYSNSKIMPFNKQFSTGGSNSIRAWASRGLGPGSFNIYDLNEHLSSLLINQQYGDMKLELNIEHRFTIIPHFFAKSNKLEGALFVDAGNIWQFNSSTEFGNSEEAKFQFNHFYKQIALGSGFGLRFHFSAIVFRVDLGLKIYDPQVNQGSWVVSELFNRGNLPDRYNMFTFNVAIGYPF